MAETNDRLNMASLFAQAIVLAMLVYVGWTVREIRSEGRNATPDAVLEWTVARPGYEPVKITLALHPGETREEWQLRLHEALIRAGDIR